MFGHFLGQSDQLEIRNSRQGFTLIEMIIVIFIIVILSALSIANYRQGEKQKRVAIAADTVINAVRNAQNFSLTSRQIISSACADGNAPASYVIFFSTSDAMQLYGVDKCNTANLIESYKLPTNVRIQQDGYKINGASVPALQFKFTPPFALITTSSSVAPNQGTFGSFTAATVTVESSDSAFEKTVTVDGVSGRIGE